MDFIYHSPMILNCTIISIIIGESILAIWNEQRFELDPPKFTMKKTVYKGVGEKNNPSPDHTPYNPVRHCATRFLWERSFFRTISWIIKLGTLISRVFHKNPPFSPSHSPQTSHSPASLHRVLDRLCHAKSEKTRVA